MKVRDVLRRLKADGWARVKAKGGHRQFKHPSKPGRVTVSGKLSHNRPAWHDVEHTQTSRLG